MQVLKQRRSSCRGAEAVPESKIIFRATVSLFLAVLINNHSKNRTHCLAHKKKGNKIT